MCLCVAVDMIGLAFNALDIIDPHPVNISLILENPIRKHNLIIGNLIKCNFLNNPRQIVMEADC